eukprot:TRINITY_DN2305_c0_g1_i6.p1 TRINITY_DN2305_c0_g1~~TRINITY_DN2305_c0_g1_i6.p1  ORF type:complete len:226 (+),score=43.27 TRINITY_DN2305_c0_g1_i6:71-748(+)
MKKLKAGLSKAKDATVGKLTKGDQNKDEEFNHQFKTLKHNQEQINKLSRCIAEYNSAAGAMLKAQQKIAEVLSNMMEGDALQRDIQPLAQSYKQVTEASINEKINLLDELIKLQFNDPLNSYLNEYKEINERVKERNRRHGEKEKLLTETAKYKAKNDPRLQSTESKLAAATQAYEDLNKELTIDMPILVADRGKFFLPVIANVIDIQGGFYKELGKQLSYVPLS